MQQLLKGKKILITSGPVWVPIDKVRIITSVFGGSLGVIMAETANAMGADVLFLMGPGRTSVKESKNLKVVKFKYFDELFSLMQREISSKKYDAVIHSAAVPDYVPQKFFDGKIKSGKKNLIIKLKPTVKIVDYIKKWDPLVFLAKFKLQVDVTENDLIKIAKESMERSKADVIVANDLLKMVGKNHVAFIIGEDGIKKINTKEKLAEELLFLIKNKL